MRTCPKNPGSTVALPGLLLAAGLLAALLPLPVRGQCHYFTQEHVDLLAVRWDASAQRLRLEASDDHGIHYASNQCVVVCPESMKFTLPAGTPLGPAGSPLWILPQNPYPGVPYVGVSTEELSPGSFQDPVQIRLLSLEGPGDFIAWQSVGFGSYDVKLDTRNGLDSTDRLLPAVGAHEHYNWGFTLPGLYRAYFQASARRPGQSDPILSDVTPFTFHILPLQPLELWTATNWPCECATNVVGIDADPDGDAALNILEYSLSLDPKTPGTEGLPAATLVSEGGQVYCALVFTRVKAANDIDYLVVAADHLAPAPWRPLNLIHRVEDLGDTERITVRDDQPVPSAGHRFYQLQVRPKPRS